MRNPFCVLTENSAIKLKTPRNTSVVARIMKNDDDDDDDDVDDADDDEDEDDKFGDKSADQICIKAQDEKISDAEIEFSIQNHNSQEDIDCWDYELQMQMDAQNFDHEHNEEYEESLPYQEIKDVDDVQYLYSIPGEIDEDEEVKYMYTVIS